jgi:transaldolase
MPLSTVEAFGDHGIVRGDTLLEGLDRANRLWSDLIRVGIDEEEVGEQLEEEGVEKFAASYLKVLDTVEDKRTQIIERDAAAMSS